MHSSIIDVVRSLYDAFGRKDIDGFLGLLDPTVEIYQTDQLPWGDRYRGIEGVVVSFQSHIDTPEIAPDLAHMRKNPRWHGGRRCVGI
ncbi:nuclear transport factor 2 family protein [Streptomyces sp. KR80]|uniref:nuclear transport factor 2 family protein n=1 Tax=Streptomyces sp. KR80 TaxID=3457426 RepID=UPI003FCF03C1